MCLAVPAKIVLVDASRDEALADLHGNQIRISTALVPDVAPGEWVLLHAGFALQRLEPGEVEQSWAVLEDLAAAAQGRGGGHG